jgi:hypothetical protein
MAVSPVNVFMHRARERSMIGCCTASSVQAYVARTRATVIMANRIVVLFGYRRLEILLS